MRSREKRDGWLKVLTGSVDRELRNVSKGMEIEREAPSLLQIKGLGWQW